MNAIYTKKIYQLMHPQSNNNYEYEDSEFEKNEADEEPFIINWI
ncbi:MAG: hypothetical protein Q4D29_05655 [Lachnospiraceae bacterium]|nr:hypothetical protein [Lachnospiraceae bacterium]